MPLLRPLETMRQLGEGAARWLRRVAARRALPRSGAFWVSIELPAPLHDVPGRFAGERAQTLLGVLQTLDAIADEPRVHGVLLSLRGEPGGLAAAQSLRRAKPVVASVAEVAASGGYYIASAADCVIAERSSLTGSIGVIGGKLDLSGLFARLGVGLDAVERGARAGMHSAARGFTDEERELVRSEMHALYDTFVARVAEGRGLATTAVERAAQGRVFTGGRALGLGLVDALGGPLEALAEVRRRAGLSRAEPVLVDLHPRVSALRALSRWFV